jgi:hypothetical protein
VTDATATAATQIAAPPNATCRDIGSDRRASWADATDGIGVDGEAPGPSALIAASASTTP